MGASAELDELVIAARAGDGDAFGEIYRRLGRPVASYVRASGGRPVDDLTNDIFLRAFRGFDRFEGDGVAFRAWIFTIAHHVTVDDIRRRRRRPDPVGRIAPPDVIGGDAEHDAVLDLTTAELILMLDGLTAMQREVLLLRVVADLSLVQAAEVMGTCVGTVKSLQRRAIAAVRRELHG